MGWGHEARVLFVAMHIPDGFVSLPVAGGGWLLAVAMLGLALRLPSQGPAPLAGLLAAFVFAAQALNFPVGVGTSGHLVGSALLSILLGPWSALRIAACVLLVQCLLFQDGGLLAWGCNVLNMGILPCFLTHAIMRLSGGGRRNRLVGAAMSGWLSVLASAVSCSLMLALSHTSLLAPTLFSMLAIHIPIALVEGLVTMATVAFLLRTRPDLVLAGQYPVSGIALAARLGLAVLLALASPLACACPDGLEAVACHLGFADRTQAPAWEIFSDYKLPFVVHPALGTAMAVCLGTLVVFGLAWRVAGGLMREPGESQA